MKPNTGNTYIRDTLVIFKRAITLSLQNPVWVIISVFQPILYLVLFGPILEKLTLVPGMPPGNSWQIFVPGLLVQLGVFGALFVGFGIVADLRSGVIGRMLAAPVHRTAIITGMVLRDVIMVTLQGIILVGLAYAFGLRISYGAFFIALFVMALLATAFAYFSYAMGLALRDENALASMVNSLVLPILLLSGILLPMSLAPRWLQIISDFNPIKHVVSALRAIFRDELFTGETALGIVLAVIIVLIGAYVGNQAIKNQTR